MIHGHINFGCFGNNSPPLPSPILLKSLYKKMTLGPGQAVSSQIRNKIYYNFWKYRRICKYNDQSIWRNSEKKNSQHPVSNMNLALYIWFIFVMMYDFVNCWPSMVAKLKKKIIKNQNLEYESCKQTFMKFRFLWEIYREIYSH